MVFGERCVVPDWVWSLAASQKRQTRRLEHSDLLEELRAFCPKPGDDYQKAILVVVRDRDSIAEHSHPEHTILFYPDPVYPVVIQGMAYQPEPGEVVYLPPNTRHAVPKNDGLRPRISIAMLVDP